MAKRKQTEATRSEIEAALLETAEKTAAQGDGGDRYIMPIPQTRAEMVRAGLTFAAEMVPCSTCGAPVARGWPCSTDGAVVL